MTFSEMLPFFLMGYSVRYTDKEGRIINFRLDISAGGWEYILGNERVLPENMRFGIEELRATTWEIIYPSISGKEQVIRIKRERPFNSPQVFW